MTATTEVVSPGTPSGRLGRGPRRPTTAPERFTSVMGHHFLVYRRTWRGSIISRFLSPLFFHSVAPAHGNNLSSEGLYTIFTHIDEVNIY